MTILISTNFNGYSLVGNSINLPSLAELYTVYGRHLGLSLAFLSQKMFVNNEFFRQISQNSDYFIVFKNPRNFSEIRTLASQLTPSTMELINIFKKATLLPYSYLFINLTQECPPEVKYLSQFFFTWQFCKMLCRINISKITYLYSH